MATPTIFADAATNPFQAKGEPQLNIAELATASVPSGTATNTIVGMFRFQKGFSPVAFQLASDALGTGATIDVGYVYDSVAQGTDAPAAFLSANTLAAAGGNYVWPVAGGLLIGQSFVATGDGYMTVRIGGATTGTTGNVRLLGTWTYNQGF